MYMKFIDANELLGHKVDIFTSLINIAYITFVCVCAFLRVCVCVCVCVCVREGERERERDCVFTS